MCNPRTKVACLSNEVQFTYKRVCSLNKVHPNDTRFIAFLSAVSMSLENDKTSVVMCGSYFFSKDCVLCASDT